MSSAIVAAASVAILAGIAVLIGAIAASRQARSYDSVILKTLGASRLQVLGAQVLEYGLLALVLALVSLVLGTAAAWYVIVQVLEFGRQSEENTSELQSLMRISYAVFCVQKKSHTLVR